VTASRAYSPRLGAYSSQPDSRPRRLQALAWLAALALLAELLYICGHSPRLAVTEVVIKGEDRVAAAVASHLRLPANTSFLFAPTRRLAAQAERVSAVRAARVSRGWGRRLVVTLERREALAVVRTEKQARLVDPTGVLFTVRNEWGWGLPEFVAPHLGRGKSTSAEAKAEVAELLCALRALGPDPRLRLARLQMDKAGQILATLDSGAQVCFGTTEQLDLKTKLLVTSMDQLGADRIAFLDLRDPWAAYWRERPETKRR
jgi:cell division septal protein FtsQ